MAHFVRFVARVAVLVALTAGVPVQAQNFQIDVQRECIVGDIVLT
jgi:hypothetical protein|tara:strand:- start:365 stop:499 length:135 start_codon:yes stop_codon:yes gene_type:complete